MSVAFAVVMAALFGSPQREGDSLRLAVLYDVAATSDGKTILWPGFGLDAGLAPWHAQYVYQARFFGDGLDGDMNFLEGNGPRLMKYRHRVSASRQAWGEFVRWELGGGWVWSRNDVLETSTDSRGVESLVAGGTTQPQFAEIVWYRVRAERTSRPLVFAAIGGAPRRWLTIAARLEFTGTFGLGLTLEGNLR